MLIFFFRLSLKLVVVTLRARNRFCLSGQWSVSPTRVVQGGCRE